MQSGTKPANLKYISNTYELNISLVLLNVEILLYYCSIKGKLAMSFIYIIIVTFENTKAIFFLLMLEWMMVRAWV